MDPNGRSGGMDFVRDNIAVAFEQYFLPSLEANISQDLWKTIQERLHNHAIRSYFVYAVANYTDYENNEPDSTSTPLFNTHLPLIAELMMLLMYLDNFILDGKGSTRNGGQIDTARINQIIISRNLLRARLEDYVDSRPGLNTEQKMMVFRTMRDIFRMVDLAQYWDKNSSGFAQYADPNFRWEPADEKSEKFLQEMLLSRGNAGDSLMGYLWEKLQTYGVKEEKRAFTEHYFRRLGLENAAFFVLWAELIMRLKGYEGSEYNRLRQFAFLFGVMAQVVNDNVDCLPQKFDPETAVKGPGDFCADVRNGLVTLPTLIYFSDNPKKSMNGLQKILCKQDDLLFDALRPTVKNKAKPYGQLMAKKLPGYLNRNNEWFKKLSDMMSYAFSRRLYRYFDDKKFET